MAKHSEPDAIEPDNDVDDMPPAALQAHKDVVHAAAQSNPHLHMALKALMPHPQHLASVFPEEGPPPPKAPHAPKAQEFTGKSPKNMAELKAIASNVGKKR